MVQSSIQLPFSSISDKEFLTTLNANEFQRKFNKEQLENIEYEPFPNLNSRGPVNDTSNNLTIPKTKYVYPDKISSVVNRPNMFSILHLNIRSIPANLDSFLDISLHNLNKQIDVLTFCETRLIANIEQLYNITGCNMYSQNRDREGGGVCMYVADKYPSFINTGLSFTENFFECVSVEIKLNTKLHLLLCVYRPPKAKLRDFITKLSKVVEEITSRDYAEIHICGDFNIDLRKCNDSNMFNEFINIMYINGFSPLITKPTRVSAQSATILDHIWTTNNINNASNHIIHTDISDHFPIISQFNRSHNAGQEQTHIKKRIISKSNTDRFLECLKETRWDDSYESDCHHEAFEKFYDKLIKAFQVNFPIVNVKINSKQLSKPWITPKLQDRIREKHRLERLADDYPITYRELYRTHRNALTKALRTAREKYDKEQLSTCQGDIKATWKSLNTILGRRTNFKPPSDDSIAAANKFNDYFIGVGQQLLGSNEMPPCNEFRNFLQAQPDFCMHLAPVTQNDTLRYLKALKPNAAGIDEFPPKLLKMAAPYLTQILTHLINSAFRNGDYPSKLKDGLVTPVPKVGDSTIPSNNRPITILLALSKIYEQAMAERLNTYLESNSLLTKSQFGFRKGMSTENALIDFTSYVYRSLDTKQHVAGVFLDFSKAFDTLDHNILIQKMEHLGIKGPVIKLFTSYLSNRKQTVRLNNNYSNTKEVLLGVPQGSILGPILFLIYINDLVNVSDILKFVLYADDTNILLSDKSPITLIEKLNSELEKVSHWIKCNKLVLNIAKTKYIFFQNRNTRLHHYPPPMLNNQPILKVKTQNSLELQ